MKIRLDFVSNSSSSSFMLVGNAFDDEELAKGWNCLHPDEKHTLNSYEIAENIAKELGLNYNRGISNYYDMYVLGLSFSSMDDNETKAQFIARIKSMLSKAFGEDVEVDECVDGGYDN